MFIKNKIISNIVQIISLLLVILFTLFVIKPAKNKIEKEIIEKRHEIFKSIEDQTGLIIKYGSISPLIVDSLVVKNIFIYSEDKKQDIEISSVVIKFSLFNAIISKWKKINAPSIISTIYVNSGKINLDFEDSEFFNKFASGEPSNSYFKGKILFNNIDVNLNLRLLRIRALSSSGSLIGRFSRYNIDLKSDVEYLAKKDAKVNSIRGDVDFKGYFSRSFKDIHSIVSIQNIDTDIGEIKDLNANLVMTNNELNITNRDKKSNFDFQYILRIPILENYFKINGDQLKISDIFTPNKNFTILDNYINSNFTGTITGSHSVIYNTLLYNIEGSLKHYEKSLSLSVNSNFNLVGDLDNLTFKEFNISTNYGYLGFIGRLDLHNFFPQGNFYIRNGKINDNVSINSDFKVNVINDHFININFDYIESLGIKVSDISSIIYIDEKDISFQGLKKDGLGKISLSGNYNIPKKSFTSSIIFDKLNLNFLKPIITGDYLTDKVENSSLSLNASIDYSNNNLSYGLANLEVLDKSGNSFLKVDGNGNYDKFSIDYLEVDFPHFDLQGRIDGEINESGLDIYLDSLINDSKYKIDFNIMDNVIKGTGSYGLDFRLVLGETIYADLKATNIPLQYKDYKTVTTLDFKTALFSDQSFLISIPTFNTVLKTPKLPFDPQFSFSADGSNEQISINDFLYKDDFSPLEGDIKVIKENTGAYSLFVLLEGIEDEKIELQSLLSQDLKSINLDLSLENLLLERLHVEGLNGRGSTNFNFNGNKEQFVAGGSVKSEDLTVLTNGAGISFDFKVDEELLKISNLNSNLNSNVLSLPLLTYNYKKGSLLGKINTFFKIGELDSSAEFAIDLSFKPLDHLLNIEKDTFYTYNGQFTIMKVITGSETLFNNKVLRVFNNSSALQVYSLDKNLKVLYSYESGLFNGKISKPYFSAMNLTGTLKDGNIDMDIRDLSLDLSFISMFLNIGQLNSLDLHGQIKLQGEILDPEINGLLWADLDLSLDNVPEDIKPIRFNIRAVDNRFSLLNSEINIGSSGKINLNGEMLFDAWKPESVIINGSIPLVNKIPIIFNYNQIVVETFLYTPELTYYMDDSGSLISGRVVIEEGEYYTQLVNVEEQIEKAPKENLTGIEVDMTVEVGVNNKLYWPNKKVPIVDATLKSGDEINIKYKSVTDEFDVKGKVSIINGEVDYSGNPFYLKEGSVDLNLSNDQIDPYIKLLASKTVVDDNERQVEVYLSFEGGFFSDFKPTFSSSDASKTEDEISSLIGLAVTGDSFGDLVFDLADEVATSYLTAPFEEAIKDIISVDDVKIKSGFISALLTNITNNSFDSIDNTSYTVAEMFSETSLTIGNFITDDFFGKLSIGSLYEDDELKPEVNLGLTLYSPHFQLGFNFSPQFSDEFEYVFEPEIELSLEWVFNPEKNKGKEN